MTFLGGVGHTLPFLIDEFRPAMILATGVVVVELAVIAWASATATWIRRAGESRVSDRRRRCYRLCGIGILIGSS